jgi:hypothetical protein
MEKTNFKIIGLFHQEMLKSYLCNHSGIDPSSSIAAYHLAKTCLHLLCFATSTMGLNNCDIIHLIHAAVLKSSFSLARTTAERAP